jgi:hypothetical protein
MAGYGSTTPRRTLLPYPKDDICAATGMQDFLATAPLNLVYVAHGNAWPTSRPKSAATMRRSMAASSAKCHLACPSAGLDHGFSRRRRLSEARPSDEASRTTASAAQFRAARIVFAGGSFGRATFSISGSTNGCFNIKDFGFRIARSKLDLNMAAITMIGPQAAGSPSSRGRLYGWSGTGFRGRMGARGGCSFLPGRIFPMSDLLLSEMLS